MSRSGRKSHKLMMLLWHCCKVRVVHGVTEVIEVGRLAIRSGRIHLIGLKRSSVVNLPRVALLIYRPYRVRWRRRGFNSYTT